MRYLTVTYGKLGESKDGRPKLTPDLVQLFLKHTYLAAVARLLVWAALSGGRGSAKRADLAGHVLTGAAFEELGLRNLVEDDFFQWTRNGEAAGRLAPLWEGLFAHLRTYDLSRLDQDVLKGVYQELVDPKDRHDLGEYYTPEWLCERLVSEMLPPKGFPRVLDPTCGSGSFLRASIAHILKGNSRVSAEKALTRILEGVVGIDIHPLAVTIARATYALAIRSLVQPGARPVQIPVYLADSLFLPAEVRQMELHGGAGIKVSFGAIESRSAGAKEVVFPSSLVKDADLFDEGIAAAARVAERHAASSGESARSLGAYLLRAVPRLKDHPDHADIARSLWEFADELSDLIRSERDSIWPFIVRNAYRPAMLKGHFDYVLGNPPWLSYRYIADPEYQARVRTLATERYAVAPPKGNLLTQMELATIFLLHALTTFGAEDARLAFVMPRSVLSADQHANLRQRKYRAPVRIDGYWDLAEVYPVFRVPSCVLFATRGQKSLATHSLRMPAQEWTGRLPERNLSWEEAEPHLLSKKITARLIWLGKRCALSPLAGNTSPSRPGRYAGEFVNGATVYPRNFYFVSIRRPQEPPKPESVYWVETDPNQAETAKPPWDSVRLSGNMEGQFLFTSIIAKHVLPFVVLDPADVVLPLVSRGGKLRMVGPDELRRTGLRDMADWMSEVERLWRLKRGAKAAESALGWLNWQNKLTEQNPSAPFRVVYNAAGTDISAARVPTGGRFDRLIIDHTLYHAPMGSAPEADYLVAILNSSVVNEVIKPFQSRGLMGERHVHKKVLELPIPAYNADRRAHVRLAELGAHAREQAEAMVQRGRLPSSLARRRSAVRAALAETLDEIDGLVRDLISA